MNKTIRVSALAIAVQAGLAALYAMPVLADDAELAALMLPTNTVEAGLSSTTRSSAKFGEYTGLNKSGERLIGNFSLRGGDAYGGNGTQRYELTGTDLGLTSRNFGASYSDQGKWSVGLVHDELTHYTSDSFQTPYNGTMGGNIYTLSGFGSAATGVTTRTLTAAQLAQFHMMDVNNTRENTSIFGTLALNSQWNMRMDFNHLEQTGAKLQSVGSSTFGGALGQKISILPLPTNSRTETANLALNWAGEKAHATVAYYGSFYRDNNNGFLFDTWSTVAQPRQTFGTPPNNNFQQLNASGGYTLSDKTKLAGGVSYSYNNQNTDYAYDNVMTSPSPTNSLNGAVTTMHADVKLTNQTTKDLLVSATLKYDDRNNRTSSNIYNAPAINGGNIYNYPNTPLSITKTQGELAGDYRVDAKQKVRMAVTYDQMDRQCNQYAVNANYPVGTNCVTATQTREGKVNATYRLKATEDLNFNAGYTLAARRTSFDQNARTAMLGTNGNLPLPTAITGLNAGDYRGFQPFFEASRNQSVLKTGANWQATERVSFTAAARYTDDTYLADYGVQKGHAWGVDLDTSFAYHEQGSLTVFLTMQERTRDLTDLSRSPFLPPSNGVPSGATFNNKMRDSDSTVGFNLKQGGLMQGKLDLAGELAYSLGQTDYYTTLNYSAPTCSSPTVLTCGSTPTIRNQMIQLKLTGNYQVDKTTKLNLSYLHRNLRSDDFYYNALQYGYTPTGLLPSNQTAPNYAVNMVFASLTYSFK